ncbi:MAG: hypothetical protein ACFB02_19480 [Mastigocoleus sp.]
MARNKFKAIRSKKCSQCSQDSSVLYRIKYQVEGNWVFVCPKCWENLSQDNPYYTYGGTWKAQKKR